MLWSHLPVALVERARLGGIDAHSKTISRSSPTSSLFLLQANKLSTVKKCLNEVYKHGGPFSPRDLYPVRSPRVSRNIS